MEYTELSKKITKDLPKCVKKKEGIYFTPPETIDKNLKRLNDYIVRRTKVLEPSCGSGEYILKLRERYPHLKISGIEKNERIYDSIKGFTGMNLMNMDYLDYEGDSYGLIIGNPPYVVLKKKEVDPKYYDYFDGRPNIFILFIIKSISLLDNNGIISFVLPKSFTNCIYYDKTRKYIRENMIILDILDCEEDYIETKQETIILIIQKTQRCEKIRKGINENYIIEKSNYTIFGTKDTIEQLKEFYKDSTTIRELGFKSSIGTVVWNQKKDILTDDSKKTRLIYNSNIVNNEFVDKDFKNEAKKKFIDRPGLGYGPLLVVNRGYGVGEYKFNYCLLDGTFDYLVENHLICIDYINNLSRLSRSYKETINDYKKIIESFENEKTKKFIRLYFGNNAINTAELDHILPIYV